MHAKPDLRVLLKWMITGSGSVIAGVIQLGFMANPFQTPATVSQSPETRSPFVFEWVAWMLPIFFAGVVIGVTEFLRSSSISVSAMNYGLYHEVNEIHRQAYDSAIVAILFSPLLFLISALIQMVLAGRSISRRLSFVAITALLWFAAYGVFWLFEIPIYDYMVD